MLGIQVLSLGLRESGESGSICRFLPWATRGVVVDWEGGPSARKDNPVLDRTKLSALDQALVLH